MRALSFAPQYDSIAKLAVPHALAEPNAQLAAGGGRSAAAGA